MKHISLIARIINVAYSLNKYAISLWYGMDCGKIICKPREYGAGTGDLSDPQMGELHEVR